MSDLRSLNDYLKFLLRNSSFVDMDGRYYLDKENFDNQTLVENSLIKEIQKACDETYQTGLSKLINNPVLYHEKSLNVQNLSESMINNQVVYSSFRNNNPVSSQFLDLIDIHHFHLVPNPGKDIKISDFVDKIKNERSYFQTLINSPNPFSEKCSAHQIKISAHNPEVYIYSKFYVAIFEYKNKNFILKKISLTPWDCGFSIPLELKLENKIKIPKYNISKRILL